MFAFRCERQIFCREHGRVCCRVHLAILTDTAVGYDDDDPCCGPESKYRFVGDDVKGQRVCVRESKSDDWPWCRITELFKRKY